MPYKNKEDANKRARERRKDPRKKKSLSKYFKNYRKANLEYIRKKERESYARHSSEKCARSKKWRIENPDKVRKYGLEHRRKSPINASMSGAIWASLKGKKCGKSWQSLVGYTLGDLKKHLENLFWPGMSWKNYGRNGWHIDHVRPKSSFKITSSTCRAFKECWSLENLQPLWEADNIRKSNRMDYELQSP